ncbi:MAG TPA: TRAP transporter substrate-binding protein DctP [Syntrophorhabdaceae bacterium]|nr:TRAP transporter substrate-binding protein DctP [Syntrophorhabdaceae bacterium]
MKKVRNLVFLLMALSLVFCALPSFTSAQQGKVIELTYGSPWPAEMTFSNADRAWIAKIEKETNGRVHIKPYFGGQIISPQGGGIEELTQGVADIGFILPNYSKSGFAICKGMSLMMYGANQVTGRRVFKELLTKFPEIEGEYKGMKVLAWSSGASFDILSKKPIRKFADMKGTRFKTSGDYAEIIKEFGAEGVNSPMSEVYVMLQKGIMDGVLVSPEGLKTMHLAEVCKYMTMTGIYRVHTASRAMNLASWNKLPPDIKKVFEDNIEFWGLATDKEFEKTDQEGLAFGKSLGLEFIPMPKDEMAKLYAVMKDKATKEAQALDAKGMPGTKIFNEGQRLIQQYSK